MRVKEQPETGDRFEEERKRGSMGNYKVARGKDKGRPNEGPGLLKTGGQRGGKTGA